MNFRRWVQIISLVCFWGLLIAVLNGVTSAFQVDLFLRFDPSAVAVTSLAGRTLEFGVLPAIIVLLLGLLLGRFFCGYVCPMGTTLDAADKLFGVPAKKRKNVSYLRSLKYLVLIFLTAAALFGVSFVFLTSPLSLITRFYGLVILPILTFFTDAGHQLLMPLWEVLDNNSLLFLQIADIRFATQWFIVLFFVVLFCLPRITPRFWCRYICPAGALMALFTFKPLFRRTVSSACTDCGKCTRNCPMGAIPEDPFKTFNDECISCLNCQRICPENAISFSEFSERKQKNPGILVPSRRQFITSGVSGAGIALVSLTGLNSAYGKVGEGQVFSPTLIRPPASLPEFDFLSRCIRCGECMVACPTNTLQPIWFDAGVAGLFSPAMVLKRGYCDPDCHQCAAVCPTQAITKIGTQEREWAKTGTAIVYRQECLAWELEEKCMVCDEVCPFGAVKVVNEPGLKVPVPKVKEEKCSGCGYCEFNCPVQNQSAIRIAPLNALRIAGGNYKDAGKQLGLKISREQKDESSYPGIDPKGAGGAPGFDTQNGTAPGFDAEDPYNKDSNNSGSLPPGFSN